MVSTELASFPLKSLATTSTKLVPSFKDTLVVNPPSLSTSTRMPFTLTRASGEVMPLIETVLVRTTLSLGRLVIFKNSPSGTAPLTVGVGAAVGAAVGSVVAVGATAGTGGEAGAGVAVATTVVGVAVAAGIVVGSGIAVGKTAGVATGGEVGVAASFGGRAVSAGAGATSWPHAARASSTVTSPVAESTRIPFTAAIPLSCQIFHP